MIPIISLYFLSKYINKNTDNGIKIRQIERESNIVNITWSKKLETLAERHKEYINNGNPNAMSAKVSKVHPSYLSQI